MVLPWGCLGSIEGQSCLGHGSRVAHTIYAKVAKQFCDTLYKGCLGNGGSLSSEEES